MPTVPVHTYPLYGGHRNPLNRIRNGIIPSGINAAAIGHYINFLLGRRLRRLFACSFAPGDTYASTGDDATIRFRTHLSPNATKVRVYVHLIPTDTPGGTNYVTPYYYWSIYNVDSTVTTTGANIYHDRRLATPANAVPNDFSVTYQDFALTVNNTYEWTLHVVDGCRVMGVSAFEVIRESLDTSVDTAVDTTAIAVNQYIYDAQIVDLITALDGVWRRQGTQHVNWVCPGQTAKTVTGTTETNIIDASTTWTANTTGLYCAPRYRHAEDTDEAATYQAPVVAWCYASATVTGNATVRLRWGTGDYISIGPITTAGFYSAAGNFPGNSDTIKVDITALGSAPTTQANVFAAGIYDYAA